MDKSRTKACSSCSRCGWVLFGYLISRLKVFFSLSLSLGEGSIQTIILTKEPLSPKQPTNQPTEQTLMNLCRNKFNFVVRGLTFKWLSFKLLYVI